MSPAPAPLLALALVACRPDAPDAGDSDATSSDSGDWYQATAPTPGWTAEDVGAQIDNFMHTATPDPGTIARVFMSWMAFGDDLCPGQGSNSFENPVSAAGCITTTGYTFSGIAWYFITEYGGPGEILDWTHGGDFAITSPEGLSFSGGGEIFFESTTTDVGKDFSFEVYGSWLDQSDPAWLDDGFSAVYAGTGTEAPDARSLTLQGGIAIGQMRLDFKDVSFTETSDCPWEPDGTIGVRDASGYWYDWTHERDCDPCGEVVFVSTGASIGELCTDLAPYGELLFEAQLPRPL